MEDTKGRSHRALRLRRQQIYFELPNDPDEVLYSGSEDESYADAEERHRKCEIEAHRYLGGRVPFLLSATLKGPFSRESGWQNPWRRTVGRTSQQLPASAPLDLPTQEPAPAQPLPAAPSPAIKRHVDVEDGHDANTRTTTMPASRAITPDTTAAVRDFNISPSQSHSCANPAILDRVRMWRNNVEIKGASKEPFWAPSDNEEIATTLKRKSSEWLRRDDIKRRRSEDLGSPQRRSFTDTSVQHQRGARLLASTKLTPTGHAHDDRWKSTASLTTIELSPTQIRDARLPSKRRSPLRRTAEKPQLFNPESPLVFAARQGALDRGCSTQPMHPQSALTSSIESSSAARPTLSNYEIPFIAVGPKHSLLPHTTKNSVHTTGIGHEGVMVEQEQVNNPKNMAAEVPMDGAEESHSVSQHDDSFSYRLLGGVNQTEPTCANRWPDNMLEKTGMGPPEPPRRTLENEADIIPEIELETASDQVPGKPLEEKCESLQDAREELPQGLKVPLEDQLHRRLEDSSLEIPREFLDEPSGLSFEELLEAMSEAAYEELLAFRTEPVQEPRNSTRESVTEQPIVELPEQSSLDHYDANSRTTTTTTTPMTSELPGEKSAETAALLAQPATSCRRDSHWDIIIGRPPSNSIRREAERHNQSQDVNVRDEEAATQDVAASACALSETNPLVVSRLLNAVSTDRPGEKQNPGKESALRPTQCAKPRVPLKEACLNARHSIAALTYHLDGGRSSKGALAGDEDGITPSSSDVQLQGLVHDALHALHSHRVDRLLEGVREQPERSCHWRRLEETPVAAITESSIDFDDELDEITLLSSGDDDAQNYSDLKSRDSDVILAQSRLSAELSKNGTVFPQLSPPQQLNNGSFASELRSGESSPLSSVPSSLVDPYEDDGFRIEPQDQSPWAPVDNAAVLVPSSMAEVSLAASIVNDNDTETMDLDLTPTRPRLAEEQSPWTATDTAEAIALLRPPTSPDSITSSRNHQPLPILPTPRQPIVLTGVANSESEAMSAAAAVAPSTPETKQSSLPTPDSTLSIKAFKLFNPKSPERPRQSMAFNGLKSVLSNPQSRASRRELNPIRRVHFESPQLGVDSSSLSGSSCDDSNDEDYIEAGLRRNRSRRNIELRATSPPPETDHLPDTVPFRNHFSTIAGRAHLGEAKSRVQKRLLPSDSQQILSSPPVNAMAERFIEADLQARHADCLTEPFGSRTLEKDLQPLDDVEDVILNLDSYLNTFDVEADLEQAKLDVQQTAPRSIYQLGMALEINVWE